MFAILTLVWIINTSKQRSFNNCKWLLESKGFSEENRKKPEVETTFQKCRSIFLNP